MKDEHFFPEAVPLRDADSSIYAVLAVSYDITERKHAEQALQKSEETLRLMIESAHEYAIFTTDLEMQVTTWNPGAERFSASPKVRFLARPQM